MGGTTACWVSAVSLAVAASHTGIMGCNSCGQPGIVLNMHRLPDAVDIFVLAYKHPFCWAYGDGELMDLHPELSYRCAPCVVEAIFMLVVISLPLAMLW